MTEEELAGMLLDIAEAIHEDYPQQAQILTATAGLTAFFEPPALEPLASMARLYSEVGYAIASEGE